MADPADIDFEAALRRGLEKIAREPDGGSTERFRKPGERPAPVRTKPVPEVTMSLKALIEHDPSAATVDAEQPPEPPDVPS